MTRLRPTRIVSTLAGLLAAAALLSSSGCGFICTDDSQCRSNICRVPLCSDSKTKIEDSALPPDFIEMLAMLLRPPELQP